MNDEDTIPLDPVSTPLPWQQCKPGPGLHQCCQADACRMRCWSVEKR